jgi:trans-aconitate methyltransferase
MIENWQHYRRYWDIHASNVGPEIAVTGLGDSYNAVVGSVIDEIAPDEVNVVFDIGCGAGLTYPLIKERWPDAEYTGVDVSPVMIRHCQANYPDGSFMVIDGVALPDGKADLMICHSVLTHIYPNDGMDYLVLIHDQLTENGRASISIHTDCAEGWRGDIGRIDYNTVYFERMLKQAGLEITAVIEGNQRAYGVKRAE